MNVDPDIIGLETHLARKRRAGGVLLSMEGYDRWGRQHDTADNQARMDAEATQAARARDEAVSALGAEVARLRVHRPAVIERWADLHVEQLRAFIDANPEAEPSSQAATAVFVAGQEIEGWLAVKRGERPFVDENVYYLQPDPDRYREAFGIDP